MLPRLFAAAPLSARRYLLALILVLTVGHASNAQSSDAQSSAFASVERITGHWDGVFQCDGYTNQFRIELSGQDAQRLSGTMTRRILGPTFKKHSQPYAESLPIVAQYDRQTGSLALGTGQGRAAEIRAQGVVSAAGDRMIGSVNWSLGRACSVWVMGKRFGGEASAIVSQSEPKLYRPKVDPRASCDQKTIDWISQSLAYDQYSIQLRGAAAYGAYALFEARRFEPFFGKSFDRLSKRDLAKLENQIARPCWGAIQSVGGQAQTAATALNVVRQRPGSRMNALLYPYARKIARSWLEQAISFTDPGNAQAVNQMTRAAQLYTQVLWPDGEFNFSVQLAAKRASDGSERMNAALEDLLSERTPGFAELENIATFEQRYVVGSASAMESPTRLTRRSRQEQLAEQQAAQAARREARSEFVVSAEAATLAQQRAANYINAHIVRAASEYAEQQTSIADVRSNLAPLNRRTNSALARYVSPDAARAVKDRFDAQRNRQAAQFAQTELDAYAQRYDPRPDGTSGLSQLNAYYRSLEQRYGALLDVPAFTALKDRAAADRQALLLAEQGSLSAAVRARDTVAGIETLLEQSVLSVDRDTQAYQPIARAVTAKRAELAPFSDYPGGEFLNAVYAGDTRTVDRLDRQYHAAFQRVFDQLGSDDVLTRLMRWTINQIRLVEPMTATYLLNYQRGYQRCLRADAAKFVVTRTVPTTVTRNLLGIEIARSEGYTTRDEFLINKEFEIIFRHVGTMQPTNFLASMVDQGVGNGGITAVTQGVRRIMDEHACDSVVVERFEDQIKTMFFR
ncbi:MAG: hypothetical protein AAGL69_16175 [Pseudomonadota bacterium]